MELYKSVFNLINRYLAVVTALTTEADYVFYPENPPPVDWPEKICKKLANLSNPSNMNLIFNIKNV